MARIHGKTGAVTFSGYADGVGITGWSIDYKCAADDSTGMDSDGVKDFLAGLTEWSGSFSGVYDSSEGKLAAGTTGAATFAAGTAPGPTISYAGDIIVTSYKVDSAIDSVVKFNCDFQGTGGLT